MRALKVAGIVVGALVALVIALLLAAKLLVNPNDFKPRIVRAVRAATGRELSLPGDVKLGVFPWVFVEFGPATLGNPPGFSPTPFMAVQHVALRVRLLPLLRKQLEVGRIDVSGLDLRLEKNARGEGNWQLTQGEQAAAATDKSSAASSTAALQDLGGVHVSDSRFSFQGLTADQVNLEIGRVKSGVSAPVSARLRLSTAPGAAPVAVEARFALQANLEASRFELTKLELSGTRAAAAAAPALTLKLAAAQLRADLEAQTLAAPTFSLQFGPAHLSGALQGSHIVDAPSLQGTFRLDPVSPRALLSTLGTQLPATRDPMALTRLSGAGAFSYGGNAAEAHELQVSLDDSTLRGDVAITDLKTQALRFDLALDQIDFDRYRAPALGSAASAPARTTSAPAQPAEPAALRSLILDGSLAVARTTVANLKATAFSTKLTARDGVMHITPVKAQLYGGSYLGDISVDSRAAVPTLKITQTLTNVDVGALLKDFAKTSRVSGRGKVVSDLTSQGLGADQLLASLNGRATVDVDNGAIEGMDLWFEINRATSLIQKQSLPAGSGTGRTRFDVFHASADITNGVASTKDLSIISQNLRVAGAGTVNLVSEAIDYKVNATVLRQPTAGAVTPANTLAAVPVNIGGTLSSPKVTPDLEGVAKARVQQELDKHKGELQQKLQDQLKNILK